MKLLLLSKSEKINLPIIEDGCKMWSLSLLLIATIISKVTMEETTVQYCISKTTADFKRLMTASGHVPTFKHRKSIRNRTTMVPCIVRLIFKDSPRSTTVNV